MIWKKSGAIYDGDWKDDRRCGFGTYSVSEGAGYRKVYSGGWKNDKRHVSTCICDCGAARQYYCKQHCFIFDLKKMTVCNKT